MVLAACIGGSFDLATLALVSGERARQVATDLWPAIEQGLILPLSDTYKLVGLEVEGLEEEVNVEYKFVHDRVQQAAYSLVPVEERPAIHWRTGQTLLRHTPEADRWERIFDIVNQLNQGPMETLDDEARLELHELNQMASRKARAAIAFEPAYGYLENRHRPPHRRRAARRRGHPTRLQGGSRAGGVAVCRCHRASLSQDRLRRGRKAGRGGRSVDRRIH